MEGGKDKDKCRKDNGKGKSSRKPYPPGLLPREEDKGNYKGGKSNRCKKGKGKEQKGKQSGKEDDKGNDKGNDNCKKLLRPLANNDYNDLNDFFFLEDKGKGKGKVKSCKRGTGGMPADFEEFMIALTFSKLPWSSVVDFPRHKQERVAGLVNRLLALRDPDADADVTEVAEEAAAEEERVRLLQQFIELWQESSMELMLLWTSATTALSKGGRKCGKGDDGSWQGNDDGHWRMETRLEWSQEWSQSGGWRDDKRDDGRWRQGKNQEQGDDDGRWRRPWDDDGSWRRSWTWSSDWSSAV